MAYYEPNPNTTPKVSILFLGRLASVVAEIESQLLSAPSLSHLDLKVCTGTSFEDAERILSTVTTEGTAIDHAFVGGGLSLDKRLEVIRMIVETSGRTCVHMKDSASGPSGGLAFLEGILAGLYPAATREG